MSLRKRLEDIAKNKSRGVVTDLVYLRQQQNQKYNIGKVRRFETDEDTGETLVIVVLPNGQEKSLKIGSNGALGPGTVVRFIEDFII